VLKSALGRALFAAARIRQIHIIGCSRSGTTMLHAAMSAFEDVELHPAETLAFQPTLRERVRVLRRIGHTAAGPRWFVTKRAFRWTEPAELEALAARALRERVGIIHIVRDPRDVLLSRHVSSNRERYVDPDHWQRSVAAADWLEARLAGRCPFFTLRYEDLVCDGRTLEARLAATFGLRLRPGAMIENVADSLKLTGKALDPYMAVNMQGVRNADPTSIGKWRASKDNPEGDLLAAPGTAELYRAFLVRHGYEAARAAA
jgi:hypothetical protein